MSVKSRKHPSYNSEDLIKEMCRYAHAATVGGFDGSDHPEYEKIIKSALTVLYPLTIDKLVEIVKGDVK